MVESLRDQLEELYPDPATLRTEVLDEECARQQKRQCYDPIAAFQDTTNINHYFSDEDTDSEGEIDIPTNLQWYASRDSNPTIPGNLVPAIFLEENVDMDIFNLLHNENDDTQHSEAITSVNGEQNQKHAAHQTSLLSDEQIQTLYNQHLPTLRKPVTYPPPKSDLQTDSNQINPTDDEIIVLQKANLAYKHNHTKASVKEDLKTFPILHNNLKVTYEQLQAVVDLYTNVKCEEMLVGTSKIAWFGIGN